MNTDPISPKKLMDVREAMASELYYAFGLMSGHLTSRDDARGSAEMREARKILHNLKHPDMDAPVSADEMEWALRRTIEACDEPALVPAVLVLCNVAAELGLNVTDPHDVPRELDKKIGNAVKVLLHAHAPVLAATA